MLNEKQNKITISELETYLNSLEKEKEREIARNVHEYKRECNLTGAKIRKREIQKIEKELEKEYKSLFIVRDELLNLIDEIKDIPNNMEELKIAEYMVYRVDLRKAEKVISKSIKRLEKRYNEIQEGIEDRIYDFPKFKDVTELGYNEYSTGGQKLAKSKEQYKLEYTEEEKRLLIKRELDMIEQTKRFNSIPIPHEILKNLDKDIQSKMQKFNTIRQKRIRILDTMQIDYEKLMIPREILCVIDDASSYIENCKYILSKNEYNCVKNALIRRKKRIYRSTKDIRSIIETKENKTGIVNFNIQNARYLRMENLRSIITNALNLIKENPIEELEEQLEKLKISYEREKQFASVIENLNDGRRRK